MPETSIHNELSFLYSSEHPKIAEHYLMRPAVEGLIKDAFKKPLTLVTAGAGYGKTQAVLSALKTVKCKSAWIQLSKLDNLGDRFWEHIAYSLKPQSQSLFESLLSIGYLESIADFNQFLRQLAKELSQSEYFILVFDDFHRINNKTILEFFKLFISARIKNISIVLISRTIPDLSLAELLSKGLLARITEDDLRFSRDEMDAYYHKQDFDLDESLSLDIYNYTDGWIFAIYLVGLAIKKGNLSNQNPILEVKIDIYDLIENEVFGSVSEKLQNFLIQLSVLDCLPAGFLDELVHDDLPLVEEMNKSHLFIRYDSLSDSYHFHPLFKKFLQTQEKGLDKEEVLKIHIAAAEWYIKNNRRYEAIFHYKECGMYDELFDIIISFDYHVARKTADVFIKLIEEAPKDAIRKRPVMRIVRAFFMFNNNRIDEAKQELIKIQNEYENLPKTKENLAILGEAYITLALISIVNLDYKFVELFKMADEYLPEGSKLVGQKLNIAEGLNVCSIKESSPGELKRHQDAIFNVAPYACRVMNGCSYGIEYLNAAESSLYIGDLKNAEKNAYEAIYKSKKYQQYDIEYMASFVLLRIFIAKGKYVEISDILHQMKKKVETFQASSCISLNDIIRSWFFVKIDKTDKVSNWIKDKEGIPKKLAPVILGREYLTRSDYLLAENRYHELLAFMQQTDRLYGKRGILFAIIQNKITRAIIYHYTKNYKASIEALNEAYELAYPNQLVMQFIEYGNKMRTLIRAARRSDDCKAPKEWLNHIYTKSSAYAKQISHIVSRYDQEHALENKNQISLSGREKEVLAHLYRGLTRAEIASSCYLSVSTVNSVIKNIYDKLGASNNTDAIRIAKERELV